MHVLSVIDLFLGLTALRPYEQTDVVKLHQYNDSEDCLAFSSFLRYTSLLRSLELCLLRAAPWEARDTFVA